MIKPIKYRKANMPKKKLEELCNQGKCCAPSGKAGSGVYCLGVIGAAVFYIQHAASFTEGLVGVLKALIWPALLIYNLLEMM